MKTGDPIPVTNPPKRLLYKGFTYVLAARSTEGATWEKTLPLIETLGKSIQDIVQDEHTLSTNAQTIADVWAQLNQYIKLLLPPR